MDQEQIKWLVDRLGEIWDTDPPKDMQQAHSQMIYNQRLIARALMTIVIRLDELEKKIDG